MKFEAELLPMAEQAHRLVQADTMFTRTIEPMKAPQPQFSFNGVTLFGDDALHVYGAIQNALQRTIDMLRAGLRAAGVTFEDDPPAAVAETPAAEPSAAPDWPPTSSATSHPEGTRKFGSTGQEWEVRNGQWVRLAEPKRGDSCHQPNTYATCGSASKCPQCPVEWTPEVAAEIEKAFKPVRANMIADVEAHQRA